jgi:type I restriction enzyme, S subunit
MSSLPKLRFPGFEGEWEEKSLGDVVCLDLKPIEKPAEAYVRLRVRSHGKGTFYETVDNPETIEMETLYEVKENQLLVNITFAWEHAICVTNQEDDGKIVSHRFPTYSFNEDNVPAFYKYYILLPRFKYYLGVASPGGAGRNRVLNKTAFLELLVPKPSSEEQTKIADFLSLIGKKITKQNEKVAALEQYKKGLMQKIFSREIRFKDDNGKDYLEWEVKDFMELFQTMSTKRHQVASSDYLEEGLYEIIDQGKDSVAGFSIDKTKLFIDIPVIIYGDHTTIVKYRRKPFIVGADGTKLLKEKTGNLLYLYYALTYGNIFAEGYKRHFSMLQKIKLPYPSLPEQTKIANFLSLYDRKIEKEKGKLEALREQKKGLLQQMFI